jgi:hypothetical protein
VRETVVARMAGFSDDFGGGDVQDGGTWSARRHGQAG